MNKYHNSKIYTIRSPQIDKFYIGSTCNKLCYRFTQHKINNKNNNGTSSFEILQFDDAYIELLENFKCESREELNKREGELIRQYKDQCVNKNIAGRTQKERDDVNKDQKKQYRENNKEHFEEYRKQYYEKNKDIILEKQKEKIKCPKCDIEIRKSDILRHNRSNKHNNVI